ncbi:MULTISPECIES: hypothetical protein [unclassified Rhodococcus (in: high G+C Gram-positive bacteria)]|uniref:hypothetical protein n=1 Tax=unclassified Rhodococcus (in: high G+C Gram-positive bacteria) TaxID=192944 RepID=UPI0002A21049|nr:MULTISPECIES: hypothetical protein [unclassified Rhodococcus (in: high G+C Gram-positive bacteria)]ELB94857.1 small heat shock protein [Rhodococcus wratislaviensis IFP 2016]
MNKTQRQAGGVVPWLHLRIAAVESPGGGIRPPSTTTLRGRISPLRDSMLGASSGDGQACRPLVDVSETDDGYVLEVEVPG